MQITTKELVRELIKRSIQRLRTIGVSPRTNFDNENPTVEYQRVMLNAKGWVHEWFFAVGGKREVIRQNPPLRVISGDAVGILVNPKVDAVYMAVTEDDGDPPVLVQLERS